MKIPIGENSCEIIPDSESISVSNIMRELPKEILVRVVWCRKEPPMNANHFTSTSGGTLCCAWCGKRFIWSE